MMLFHLSGPSDVETGRPCLKMSSNDDPALFIRIQFVADSYVIPMQIDWKPILENAGYFASSLSGSESASSTLYSKLFCQYRLLAWKVLFL